MAFLAELWTLMSLEYALIISDCGDPAPTHGSAAAPKGTTFGEVAIISCDDGYTLDGEYFITCLETGNWSSYGKCNVVGRASLFSSLINIHTACRGAPEFLFYSQRTFRADFLFIRKKIWEHCSHYCHCE